MDAGDAHAKSDMYHLEDEVKQELARLDTVLLERNDAVAGTMTPPPLPSANIRGRSPAVFSCSLFVVSSQG
jgi:hypothetical protein